MATIAELTTLRDAAYDAYQECLLGKDIMFDGHRVTIDDSDRLLKQFLMLDRMILRMGGTGYVTKNNVGLKKRDY